MGQDLKQKTVWATELRDFLRLRNKEKACVVLGFLSVCELYIVFKSKTGPGESDKL